MSNLLLTPSKFRGLTGGSPPVAWNAGQGRYVFLNPNGGTGIEINSLISNGAGLTPGDSIHFKANINAVSPGTRLRVMIGSVMVFDQLVTNGMEVDVDTADATSPSDVRIYFVMQGGGNIVDATLTPRPEQTESGDTYLMKGFVAYGALASNVPNVVAPLGELSVYSATFAKDRLLFGDATNTSPDTSVNISVFTSKLADGTEVVVPAKFSETLVDLGQWAYTQAINGQFNSDPETFRQQILAEFDGLIYDVTVGQMVQQGSVWMPQFVTFYIDRDQYSGYTWPPGSEGFNQPRMKLWFSDEAFKTQYDEFHLEFIAPLDNLDDFFLIADQVVERVALRTQTQLLERVQSLTDQKPYTLLKSVPFLYHDPLDESFTHSTNWVFLIWGAAGDNIDAIKEQLAEWILDNSTHTREEWVTIFPDIFTSTEFIITPMWNQHAVPNQTLQAGVYSPSVNVQRALTIARKTCTGTNYNNVHVDENLAVVSSMFKSISLLICGGPENRNGNARFECEYRDYMAVVTSSPDFSRMQPETQDWINKIYEMLIVAEEMTEFSDIPLGMTRLKRRTPANDEILYLVRSIRDVQYLMVAASTLNALFPEEDGTIDLGLVPSPSVTLSTPTGSNQLEVNFNGVGGTGPYTYSAASPTGTGSIDSMTGYLSMTFPTAGDHLLDVTVEDVLGEVFTGTYTVSADEGSGT